MYQKSRNSFDDTIQYVDIKNNISIFSKYQVITTD